MSETYSDNWELVWDPDTEALDPAVLEVRILLRSFHVLVDDAGAIVGARVHEFTEGRYIDRELDCEALESLVTELKFTLSYLTQENLNV